MFDVGRCNASCFGIFFKHAAELRLRLGRLLMFLLCGGGGWRRGSL